jgi:hypothetical protein
MTQPSGPALGVCALCRRTVPLHDREPIGGTATCPVVQLPENAPYRPHTLAGVLAADDGTLSPADIRAELEGPRSVLAFVDDRWKVAERGLRAAMLQLFIFGGIVTFLALFVVSVITAAVGACVMLMMAEDRLGHAAWSAGATVTGTGALLMIRSLVRRGGKRGR